MTDAGAATGGPAEPARARAVRAVAVIAGVALVGAALVAAGARLTGGAEPGGPPAASLEEGVPTQLAGGLEPGPVPDVVAAAFDEPVVGARVLDEDAEVVDGCPTRFEEFHDEPELEFAVATPDGAVAVQQRGEYWLALPTQDAPVIPLSWKSHNGAFAASTTHVLFLDEDGTVLDEADVGA